MVNPKEVQRCEECGSKTFRYGIGRKTCDNCGSVYYTSSVKKYPPRRQPDNKEPTKKKLTRTQLKAKCDVRASLYYRNQTPYCELAGKDHITCSQQLQWMHLITRSNLRLRYEPFNKLIGCGGHHMYYTMNPIDWVRFLEQWFPERLAEAEAHKNEIGKPDYAALIEQFK